MTRNPLTKANQLIKELQHIPKIIAELKRDIERTRSQLLPSQTWSNIRVSGGIRKTQDDRLTTIIDVSDYNKAEIERLLERKKAILDYMASVLDSEEYLMVLALSLRETNDEAMDQLQYSRRKFYIMKKKVIQKLDTILESKAI